MTRKRECPSCATPVPDDHDRCFICGYEFPDGGTRRSWRTWAAVILVVIFLIPFIRLVWSLLD